jgi:hypothetical protein
MIADLWMRFQPWPPEYQQHFVRNGLRILGKISNDQCGEELGMTHKTDWGKTEKKRTQ